MAMVAGHVKLFLITIKTVKKYEHDHEHIYKYILSILCVRNENYYYPSAAFLVISISFDV